MHPRLVALSEPSRGRTYELEGRQLSIGRHPSNQIRARQLTVSRNHCLLLRRASEWVVQDLQSRHGTFVNDTPVRERALAHGDLIRVGEALFLYLLGEPSRVEEKGSVVLDDGEFDAGTTVKARLEDLTPIDGRATRELDALLSMSRAVHSLRAVEALAQRLLELAFELTPAERGAVLLVRSDAARPDAARPDTGPPDAAEIVDSFTGRRQAGDRPFHVSRTVVRQVLAEPVALRCEDVFQNTSLDADSLRSARVRSLICVPLAATVGNHGVLYLDIVEADDAFDNRHLELAAAGASVAAPALASARYVEWLQTENRRLQAAADHDMVGESPAMRKLFALISRVAPTDATVLIRGESGTGKELVARAIHRASPRAERAFVALNCATFSETLLESELFGHEKGAFTGAVARKRGKLEIAAGGTLFLDEVGELPVAIQAKLLRVLQEREIERVGGSRPIAVDLRIVAATNRDLERAIREGKFREDLFFRLAVVALELPPLRQRGADVGLLASHFVAHFSRKLHRRVIGLTPEARSCIERYDWPGNVRELANAVERAIILGEGELIRAEDLPETLLDSAPADKVSIAGYHRAIRDFKRELVRGAVQESGGNITRAAEQLGINANYLHRLLHKLDLRAAPDRP